MVPHTILFMAANPATTDGRGLDDQARAIQVELERAERRGCFRFETRWAAQPLDLLREMVKLKPTVVHFCGGRLADRRDDACAGGVFFQTPDGRVQLVSAAALVKAFDAAGSVKLVVLDACYSEAHADAVAVHIDCVVGMAGETVDGAATSFAIGLYGGLGGGEPVTAAFKQGCAAIALMGVGDTDQPQLRVRRGVGASRLVLADASLAPPATAAAVADQRVPGFAAITPGTRVGVAVAVDAAAGGLDRSELSQRPGCGVVIAVGAVVMGLLYVGWLALRPTPSIPPAPAPPKPVPPPRTLQRVIRGMVQFDAAEVRPGVFDLSQRPSCPTLDTRDDCAELTHPERVASVAVDAFELDVQEVSNAEFAAWLKANSALWHTDPFGVIASRSSNHPLIWASQDCLGALEIAKDGQITVAPDKAHWPAVCVTWYGATEYCRAQHKRLPLAAEWELAAKGSGGRAFPWGSVPPRDDGVSFASGDVASAHPRDVGSSPQDISPEGVHDLGGSVAEWIADGGDGDKRMIRGGSWGSRDACHLLSSGCKRLPSDAYGKDVGFRCASSVIEH